MLPVERSGNAESGETDQHCEEENSVLQARKTSQRKSVVVEEQQTLQRGTYQETEMSELNSFENTRTHIDSQLSEERPRKIKNVDVVSKNDQSKQQSTGVSETVILCNNPGYQIPSNPLKTDNGCTSSMFDPAAVKNLFGQRAPSCSVTFGEPEQKRLVELYAERAVVSTTIESNKAGFPSSLKIGYPRFDHGDLVRSFPKDVQNVIKGIRADMSMLYSSFKSAVQTRLVGYYEAIDKAVTLEVQGIMAKIPEKDHQLVIEQTLQKVKEAEQSGIPKFTVRTKSKKRHSKRAREQRRLFQKKKREKKHKKREMLRS